MICDICNRTMEETTIYGIIIKEKLYIRCFQHRFWKEKNQTQLKEYYNAKNN